VSVFVSTIHIKSGNGERFCKYFTHKIWGFVSCFCNYFTQISNLLFIKIFKLKNPIKMGDCERFYRFRYIITLHGDITVKLKNHINNGRL
jgi:hypothetical protein